jgi:hypothetical protein
MKLNSLNRMAWRGSIGEAIAPGIAFLVALTFGVVTLAQPATAPPWNPASFKPGSKVTSKDNLIMVTVVLPGPPKSKLWSYKVQGLHCDQCGGSNPQIILRSVRIVSNAVPRPCGNMKPDAVFKPVQTHTPNWASNGTGDTLREVDADHTVSMTFKIECEASNGPIYLVVDWENDSNHQKGQASVGPMPGPVSPQ